MSKQDYIVQLISNAEIDNGIIEQTLYEFLVESVSGYFNASKKEAKKAVMKTLKELYMVAT